MACAVLPDALAFLDVRQTQQAAARAPQQLPTIVERHAEAATAAAEPLPHRPKPSNQPQDRLGERGGFSYAIKYSYNVVHGPPLSHAECSEWTIWQHAACLMVVPSLMRSSTSCAGYKYKETVRKKAEREELTGVECVDCKKFYAAIETWGAVGNLPACGHAVRGDPSS